jgi:hypothetical protein
MLETDTDKLLFKLSGIVGRAWDRYREIEKKLAEPDRSKNNKKRLRHERVKLKIILGITEEEKNEQPDN